MPAGALLGYAAPGISRAIAALVARNAPGMLGTGMLGSMLAGQMMRDGWGASEGWGGGIDVGNLDSGGGVAPGSFPTGSEDLWTDPGGKGGGIVQGGGMPSGGTGWGSGEGEGGAMFGAVNPMALLMSSLFPQMLLRGTESEGSGAGVDVGTALGGGLDGGVDLPFDPGGGRGTGGGSATGGGSLVPGGKGMGKGSGAMFDAVDPISMLLSSLFPGMLREANEGWGGGIDVGSGGPMGIGSGEGSAKGGSVHGNVKPFDWTMDLGGRGEGEAPGGGNTEGLGSYGFPPTAVRSAVEAAKNIARKRPNRIIGAPEFF